MSQRLQPKEQMLTIDRNCGPFFKEFRAPAIDVWPENSENHII
jgi:hypothetical protein